MIKLRTRLERLLTRHNNLVSIILSMVGIVVTVLIALSEKFSGTDYVRTIVILIPIVCFFLLCRLSMHKYRSNYLSTISGKQYYAWQLKAMEKLYGAKSLTKAFGEVYSAKTIQFDSVRSVLDEDTVSLLKSGNIKNQVKNHGIVNKMFPGWKNAVTRLEYRLIVESSIKFEVPGYILDRYSFDKRTIYCKIGMYRQNIYTSNILEFELYKAFMKLKKSALNSDIPVPDNLLDFLPMRKLIHRKCNYDLNTILMTGTGRFSLLSVQLMIVYRSSKDNKYKTLIKKRSGKGLTSKLNYLQFVPSGGFDMCETERYIFNIKKMEVGCNLETVVWREFLEELFNQKNFQGVYDDPGNTDPENKIYGSNQMKLIERLRKEGKARFKVLGSVIDLNNLRHNISYLLHVTDDAGEFEREIINNIDFNNEFTYDSESWESLIDLQKLDDMKGYEDSRMITSESAGLYHLFSEYREQQKREKEPKKEGKITITIL